MYMISFVDRTNVALALDPRISAMMRDLLMDDRMKGQAAGIFFIGYVMFQMPAGYLAHHWSARKLISVLLVLWGAWAAACGLVHSYRQFEGARFLLGISESGVFPAMTVLLADWFPQSERARANAYWYLCQPLAVVLSAPLSGWLLGGYGWRTMLVVEGLLPFFCLPFWWYLIRDHPSQAPWLPAPEQRFLAAAFAREADEFGQERQRGGPARILRRQVLIMTVMFFFSTSAAYGCMTFFTACLNERNFSTRQYSLLFALPYLFAALVMILNSWHSDLTQERRGHIAWVYAAGGACLMAGVLLGGHFWLRYLLLGCSIPGAFAATAPLYAILTETLPRLKRGPAVGFVGGIGNLGGFLGPYLVGVLKQAYGSVAVPFAVLGVGLVAAAGLAFLLPRSARRAADREGMSPLSAGPSASE